MATVELIQVLDLSEPDWATQVTSYEEWLVQGVTEELTLFVYFENTYGREKIWVSYNFPAIQDDLPIVWGK